MSGAGRVSVADTDRVDPSLPGVVQSSSPAQINGRTSPRFAQAAPSAIPTSSPPCLGLRAENSAHEFVLLSRGRAVACRTCGS